LPGLGSTLMTYNRCGNRNPSLIQDNVITD
jgi:hypothetical protein